MKWLLSSNKIVVSGFYRLKKWAWRLILKRKPRIVFWIERKGAPEKEVYLFSL
jgi:hypothetical protein